MQGFVVFSAALLFSAMLLIAAAGVNAQAENKTTGSSEKNAPSLLTTGQVGANANASGIPSLAHTSSTEEMVASSTDAAPVSPSSSDVTEQSVQLEVQHDMSTHSEPAPSDQKVSGLSADSEKPVENMNNTKSHEVDTETTTSAPDGKSPNAGIANSFGWLISSGLLLAVCLFMF